MSLSPLTYPSSHLEAPPTSQPLEVVDSGTAALIPEPSLFDQTTNNLLRLGSLTMDKFAQDPSEELDGFDIPLLDPTNPNSSAYSGGKAMDGLDNNTQIPNVSPSESVRYLRDLTQRVFGPTKIEPLKFDIIEDLGSNRMSCFLTVTRPYGDTRCYRTKPEFSRKAEARLAAATLAIQMGCVNFIKNGDESGKPKRGIMLAKLDAGIKKGEGDAAAAGVANSENGGVTDTGLDTAVMDIENACTEWRAGTVIPQWVYYQDVKNDNGHGCAVKISLSPHIQKTFSILPSKEYDKRALAKVACARLAIKEGILDFIQHGDGLEGPVVAPPGVALGPDAPHLPVTTTSMTVKAFHDSLPKPMPEEIACKSSGEPNAIGWFNGIFNQFTKGSRMTQKFISHTDAKLGLHGAIIRLSRPDGPSQSYMVDAMFSKRLDAKIAACIYACSQGFGQWARNLGAEIDQRVTPDMRRRTSEILGALKKIKYGLQPVYAQSEEVQTFDCALTIHLTDDSGRPRSKTWSVPFAYKTKQDAKVAATCVAADNGLFEFVKNPGEDQENDVDMRDGDVDEMGGKRKRNGEPESGQQKIAKTGAGMRGRFDGNYAGKRPFGDRTFNRLHGMSGRGRGSYRGGGGAFRGNGLRPSGGCGRGRGQFPQFGGLNRQLYTGNLTDSAAFHPGNFGPYGMAPQFAIPALFGNLEYINHNYRSAAAAGSVPDWPGARFGVGSALGDGYIHGPGFSDHERPGDHGYPRERDFRQSHHLYATAVPSPGSAAAATVVPPGSGPGPYFDPADFSYENEEEKGGEGLEGLVSRVQAYEEPERYAHVPAHAPPPLQNRQPPTAPRADRLAAQQGITPGSRKYAHLNRYTRALNNSSSRPSNNVRSRPSPSNNVRSLPPPSNNVRSRPSPTDNEPPLPYEDPAPLQASSLPTPEDTPPKSVVSSAEHLRPPRIERGRTGSLPAPEDTPPKSAVTSSVEHLRPPRIERQTGTPPTAPAADRDTQQKSAVVSSVEHLRPPRIERRKLEQQQNSDSPALKAQKTQNAADSKLDTVNAKVEKEAVPADDDEPTARGRRRNLPGASIHEDSFSKSLKRSRSFDDDDTSSCSTPIRGRGEDRSRSTSGPEIARNKPRDAKPGNGNQSSETKNTPIPEEPAPLPSSPPSTPPVKKQKLRKAEKHAHKSKKARAVEEGDEGDEERNCGNAEPKAEAEAKTDGVSRKASKPKKNDVREMEVDGAKEIKANGTSKREKKLAAEKSGLNGTDTAVEANDNQANVEKPRKRKDKDHKDRSRKSFLASLYETCEKESLPRPELFHESKQVDEANNITDGFKVWAVVGNERLDHPQVFATLKAGQERLAKGLLKRLKDKFQENNDEES